MKTTDLQKKELLEKDLRSYKKLYELQKSIKEEIDELKSSIISDMEELGESKILSLLMIRRPPRSTPLYSSAA